MLPPRTRRFVSTVISPTWSGRHSLSSGAFRGELAAARILVPHRDFVYVDRHDLAARLRCGVAEALERLVAAAQCLAVVEERDPEHLGAFPVDEHPEPK